MVIPVDELRPAIRIDAEPQQDVQILVADGVLDSSTYRSMRDAVIKAALDEPLAVIVDVNDLSVPSESAWSVFTSARWHVSIWPDVPILLVCAHPQHRLAISRRGLVPSVPAHPTCESALDAAPERRLPGRWRARTQLPADPASIGV